MTKTNTTYTPPLTLTDNSLVTPGIKTRSHSAGEIVVKSNSGQKGHGEGQCQGQGQGQGRMDARRNSSGASLAEVSNITPVQEEDHVPTPQFTTQPGLLKNVGFFEILNVGLILLN